MAALGAFWAYLEPLGKGGGLDGQAAQTLISGVLLMQVIGGSLGALAVRRLMPESVLLIASLGIVAIMTGVHRLPLGQVTTFAAASLAFGFVWLFALPFHVSLAFRAEATGRLAGLVPAAQLLGSACGPLLASFFVRGEDAPAVPLISTAFALATGLLLSGMRWLVAPRARQQA